MAELDFRMLNTNAPAQIAGSFAAGQQEAEANRLAQIQRQQQQYVLGKAQREDAAQNALAEAYRTAYNADTGQVDQNALMKTLAGGGQGQMIPGIQEGQIKQQKAQAEVGKIGAETSVKQIEAAHKRADLAGQAFGFVRSNPTPENANAAIDYLAQNGVYTPEEAAQHKAKIAANPQAVGQMAEMAFQGALATKDQLNKYETRNLGGTTETMAINPVTGKVQTVAAQRNTQSPESIASNATARYGIARTDARAREANALKAQENVINKEGLVGKRVQDVEMKLQDDYRQESKGFSETSTAMKKISGAIETADKNPGSALAAGTAFMKLLDPNSVVRESELGMALNASGWFDRAFNVANTLQSGKVMTAEQKKNLKAASDDLFEEAKAAQREVDAAYKQRALAYGADPERVIVNRGQSIKRGENPSAGPGKVTAVPPVNKQGWKLHQDANGNRAYVGPNGQIEEVK